MCRLFGCSVSEEEDHVFYLQDIAHRLHILSEKHADGWGMAYYLNGFPHIQRSERAARECQMFSKMAPQIRANLMLVHLRKATMGPVDILNTHPFQYGQWVFAHNGHIDCPQGNQVCLRDLVDDDKQHLILGDTDSEQLFYLFISTLQCKNHLKYLQSQDLADVVTKFVQCVRHRVGPFEEDSKKIGSTFLSFLASDGRRLLAFQGGQELFWRQDVGVSVISDPLHDKKKWSPLGFGELLIVEDGQVIFKETLPVQLT